MLGLFGTLNLGTRSLQTQQTGIEVTGQNLANVNNSAYARQRVQIQTSTTLPSAIGPQGTGAEAVAIQQLRDSLLDGQIVDEASVGGYWQSQQSVLEKAQALLGETLGASGAGSSGIAQKMSDFFTSLQKVASSPESLSERQNLVAKARTLCDALNQVSKSLNSLRVDETGSMLYADVDSANQLFAEIAKLNDEVANAELGGGAANDLRDLRQHKLEELAKLTNFDMTTGTDGSVNISIDGNQIVSGSQVVDTIQMNLSYVYTVNSNTMLNLTGGSLQGTMTARYGELDDLQSSLNTLTGMLIVGFNNIYQQGYDLTGSGGKLFFGGTNASNISVDSSVRLDPRAFQASGVSGNTGDNAIALQLAQFVQTANASLGNQDFTAYYSSQVAVLGTNLENVKSQLDGHDVVNSMLLQQRDSISGVSIDEEMTNLITYQKAYQASAKIVATVEEMLDTIINMKR